jgi:hypothetical protein
MLSYIYSRKYNSDSKAKYKLHRRVIFCFAFYKKKKILKKCTFFRSFILTVHCYDSIGCVVLMSCVERICKWFLTEILIYPTKVGPRINLKGLLGVSRYSCMESSYNDLETDSH